MRIFWAQFSELQLRVRKNVFTKNIFLEKKVFFTNLLLFFSVFYSCLWRKIYGSAGNKAFFMSRGKFMENELFEPKNLLDFYAFWAICFCDLAGSFNRDARTSHYMLAELLSKTIYLEKCIITEVFSDCERKVFGQIFLKNFRCFQRKLFTEKTILLKNHVFFGFMQKVFPHNWWKRFRKMFKTAFQIVQRSMIPEKKLLLDKVVFFQVRIWRKCFSAVLRQLFDILAKIAIQVSTERFWRNNVLFLFETIFF